MSAPSQFAINLSEKFPEDLTNSPILEAVIHWEAPASKPLEQILLKEALTKHLPEYPTIQTQYVTEAKIMGTPDDTSQFSQHTQWNGFRLEDDRKNYVAQFTHTGIAFSRVQSYESWKNFKNEALRVWDVFVELAEPKTIRRLGVRFINRILIKQDESISTYLKSEPYRLSGLEISPKSFFYQDTYQVAGYPYQINLVRTIQPNQTGSGSEQALIVDIDVFTNEVSSIRDDLNQQLAEMRWLKNKIFFSNITDTALNNFGS
ncbi:MAG: TIGR04255 family protein [Pseudanabaena sp. Salubria-1]|jgi:uncharacterized protein (TIGR04255 family)|nr:TIGR04255 family protein [Pseudanabaena sp. Salubria-1]